MVPVAYGFHLHASGPGCLPETIKNYPYHRPLFCTRNKGHFLCAKGGGCLCRKPLSAPLPTNNIASKHRFDGNMQHLKRGRTAILPTPRPSLPNPTFILHFGGKQLNGQTGPILLLRGAQYYSHVDGFLCNLHMTVRVIAL